MLIYIVLKPNFNPSKFGPPTTLRIIVIYSGACVDETLLQVQLIIVGATGNYNLFC